MIGRIHVLSGPDQGRNFDVTSEQAQTTGPEGSGVLIGRSSRAQVQLTDPTISIEHALITFHENAFCLENLSAHGTFINDTDLAQAAKAAKNAPSGSSQDSRIRLRHRDRIKLSPTTILRFESQTGATQQIRLLLVTLLVLIGIGGGILVFWNPWDKPDPNNWDQGYQQLSNWMQEEIKDGRLPMETAVLMSEGWRLEHSGNHRSAADKWWKIQMILEDPQGTHRHYLQAEADDKPQNKNASHPSALKILVTPIDPLKGKNTPELSPTQWEAAFAEFVRYRFNYSSQQATNSGPLK